ncbi:MAG: hypothetical protein K7J15_02615 [Candidatus Regiella insecticola]|nr:hypothetical protein [Candidatus Regiella insecticola]
MSLIDLLIRQLSLIIIIIIIIIINNENKKSKDKRDYKKFKGKTTKQIIWNELTS